MLRYAALVLRCVSFHNMHLHERARVDFRRLSEKVDRETDMGDSQYRHVFQRDTPPDVHGAVAQVKVR